MADANGAITSSTTYDSFGNATSNIATTYRYTGREYDADTGLYYYRNRWYDPEIGRFISEDPIGFAGGDVNLYGYVGNNPHGYIDPFGFWRCAPTDPPSGWWDVVQGVLDVAGLAPVVGLPADVLNAGISTARGNYTDAALSMAAAVPVLGTAAGAGKIAGKVARALKKSKTSTAKGGNSLARVRHHTSLEGVRGIKSDGAINPGRGSPVGVHVETAPFGPSKTASAETGAFGKGWFVEFDVPPSSVSPTKVGPRSTGVIPTNKPLSIKNANPRFRRQ